MTAYKCIAEIGIAKPISFLVWASSPDEAEQLASNPDDDLRAVIECKMHDCRVDPKLRGWHNYGVLSVSVYRGQYYG